MGLKYGYFLLALLLPVEILLVIFAVLQYFLAIVVTNFSKRVHNNIEIRITKTWPICCGLRARLSNLDWRWRIGFPVDSMRAQKLCQFSWLVGTLFRGICLQSMNLSELSPEICRDFWSKWSRARSCLRIGSCCHRLAAAGTILEAIPASTSHCRCNNAHFPTWVSNLLIENWFKFPKNRHRRLLVFFQQSRVFVKSAGRTCRDWPSCNAAFRT